MDGEAAPQVDGTQGRGRYGRGEGAASVKAVVQKRSFQKQSGLRSYVDHLVLLFFSMLLGEFIHRSCAIKTIRNVAWAWRPSCPPSTGNYVVGRAARRIHARLYWSTSAGSLTTYKRYRQYNVQHTKAMTRLRVDTLWPTRRHHIYISLVR